MKLALVHDWLNQKAGGAEKVVEVLAAMFSDAPIFTLIFNPEKFDYPPERIITSRLQHAPKILKIKSRYLLPLIPGAVSAWDFQDYDVVLSSSSAFVKNIVTPPDTRHICYCHTPMRFVWDYWPKYLDEQNVGPLRRAYVRRQVKKLRQWDLDGVERVDTFIANSKTVQARIRQYYGRESELVYPPVDAGLRRAKAKGDYYATLCSLTPYKKIDLVISAFNESGRRLKIIGDGSDRPRLEAMAKENIEFAGFADDESKLAILERARGVIFPNKEDFGITAVEALATGTPVIAYGKGGVTEIVEPNKSGVFFSSLTPQSLNNAVETAEKIPFKTSDLHARAKRFSRSRFETAIRKQVYAKK